MSISDIILEQGRIQAEARRRAGDIAAQTWSGIGQTIAGIPQQIQQQRVDALKQQDLAAQVQERQATAQKNVQAEKDNTTISSAIGSAWKTDENGVHTLDRPAFEDTLVKSGLGSKLPQFSELLDHMDESSAKAHAQQRDVLAHAIYLAREAGGTPEAVQTAAQYVRENGFAQDQHLAPVLASVQANPDRGMALLDQMGQQIPEYRTLVDSEEKRKGDRAKAAADLAKTTADTAKVNAEVSGTLPAPAAEAETTRHNKALEEIAKLNAGREAATAAETKRHNLATEVANNPFGAVAPTSGPGVLPSATPAGAPADAPTGDAFLKTLDPGVAQEVKAYAEGKRPFPTGMSMYRLQPLIKLVSQYDPSFDAANYNARNKARMDFTSPSGTGGKTINALNTALQHAGTLSDLIEKLDNYGSPVANAIVNPLRTAGGSTAVTNYNAVAPQLAKEIERAWRGAGGSTADIQQLTDSIGKNLGKQQQREALENFVDLLKGKLDATEQQRDNVLGPTVGAQIPILYRQNQPIIDKITQRAGGSTDTTTTPTFIEAKDPQGNIKHAPVGTPLPDGWTLVTK